MEKEMITKSSQKSIESKDEKYQKEEKIKTKEFLDN